MTDKLAIEGGTPVRSGMLSYGRQSIDDDDVRAVVDVMRGDWLTTGPSIDLFEQAFAGYVGAAEAVAVNNGTAALHAAMFAAGIGPGDEVIVPAMTFVASANCVVFQGGRPVIVDVLPDTLLLDPAQVEAALTERTRAVVAVDYTGQPCDYDRLQDICTRNGLHLVADACHALGAQYKGGMVGSIAELSAYSFHPVKHITTGEGGMVTTDDAERAARMRRFRNHNIATDFRRREQAGSWRYDVVELGYNYRLTDIQAALGLRQLSHIDDWVTRRREIAAAYDRSFADIAEVEPLSVSPDVRHAYHLYVVQLQLERLTVGREQVFKALRAEGIGVNVHYIPVHLHTLYRERFGTEPGQCPTAEAAYERILSLPLFQGMSTRDLNDVVTAVQRVVRRYRR